MPPTTALIPIPDPDLKQFLFSVVYSASCCKDVEVMDFAPPHVEDTELWEKTEGDGSYEYDHLEGAWEGGHHRKWGALLTFEQFEEFLNECELEAEDVRSMGTLGAPGCGFGIVPNISFRADRNPGAIVEAVVTPLPPGEPPESAEEEEEIWERIRSCIIGRYEHGVPVE